MRASRALGVPQVAMSRGTLGYARSARALSPSGERTRVCLSSASHVTLGPALVQVSVIVFLREVGPLVPRAEFVDFLVGVHPINLLPGEAESGSAGVHPDEE